MENSFYGLWYKEPANAWIDALPVGNGRLGASVYGGIQQETIVLNEETVWDGQKSIDRTNDDAYQSLLDIREAIFNQENDKAAKISKHMLGIPETINSYQPLMNIHIFLMNTGKYHDYIRKLDIKNALYYIRYSLERYSYQREIFVSRPDDLLIMRWETDCPKGMTLKILLDSFGPVEVKINGGTMALNGKCCEGGVEFASVVQVMIDSGEITQERGMLLVDKAMHIEFRIAAYTDYILCNPEKRCNELLNQVRTKSYEEIKNAHVKEYQSLYGRQSFSLNAYTTEKTTKEMLDDYRNGGEDNGLIELYYNYLRYLLICSSRPGGQPSNLQGIWNDNMQAPWNSDYHPNVNMQINYWAAEGFNLPECVEPLIDWLKKIVPSGEKTARIHYHARGWVLHHISDIFGCTTPMDGPWGIWPFGGIWLCRHVYDHYLYNYDGNEKYLKEEVLPLLEGAVLFMLDFLIECPKGLPGENHLVTCPSHSPENRFTDNRGAVCYLTYAATMDMEIIYDLFEIYIKCLDELGINNEIKREVAEAKDKLVPIRINKKTGCIAEWIDDYEETEPGHRHVSHLYALYPGDQIIDQKELLEACEKTLNRRLSNGYDGQGWSYGWIAILFARLKKSEKFTEILDRIVRGHLLDNLFIDAHGRPQVGDGQVFAAAVQEAFIQSHKKEIEIFPILPDRWPEGSLCGIKVRGGHIFDLYWEKGTIKKVKLKAAKNQKIRVKVMLGQVLGTDGTIIAFRDKETGIFTFDVETDEEYLFLP